MLHFLAAIQLWFGWGAEKATMATTCTIGNVTFNGVLLFSQKVQDEVAKWWNQRASYA
jgi:hypothetical protein